RHPMEVEQGHNDPLAGVRSPRLCCGSWMRGASRRRPPAARSIFAPCGVDPRPRVDKRARNALRPGGRLGYHLDRERPAERGVAMISSRTREKAYATQREVSHRLAHVPHLRATVEPPRQPGEPFRTRVRASD